MHDKLTTCGLDYLVFKMTYACKDYHTFCDSSPVEILEGMETFISRDIRGDKNIFFSFRTISY